MRNEQMDAIEKALKRELKHLPIPVLIFYSDHPERVERLIQLFKKRGNEKEMKFLERLERIRVYWDQHHRVPEYGWDEDGYMLKQREKGVIVGDQAASSPLPSHPDSAYIQGNIQFSQYEQETL